MKCESCGNLFTYPDYISYSTSYMYRVKREEGQVYWTNSPSGWPVWHPKRFAPTCPHCQTPLNKIKEYIWIGKDNKEYDSVEGAEETHHSSTGSAKSG